MSKVKSYPSRELRHLRLEWLRSKRRYVLAMAAFYIAVVAASICYGFVFANAFGWYCIGVLHAGLAAMLLHLLDSAVLAHEPRAIFQLRGSWGEDNTRSELQSARKRKLIWGWVDSITLQGGDLDHVVVTRQGGIVVLDSKFYTNVTAVRVAEMATAAARARVRAEALSRSLLRADKTGRHRAAVQSVTVTSCIVLWGPARETVPLDHVVDGVHFIDGRRLQEWLSRLPTASVSRDAGKELLAGLTARRDALVSQV